MSKTTFSAKVAAVAGALAIGFTAVPAQAGGGDFGAPPPAPLPPVDAGRTIWEGFHFGGHAGWGDYDYGIGQTNPGTPLVSIGNSDDTFVGGFLYGTTWQSGNFVFGTDSAYTFGDEKSGLSVAANGLAATADVKFTSESRARAGFLIQPNTLIYGTVGLAYASIEASGSLIGGSNDKGAFGIVLGGGIETTLDNRWFARVEYLYSDYEKEKFKQVGGGSFDVDLDNSTVRGAIGYRFDWSPWDLLRGR